jgi:hypothetical protein
MVAICGDVEDLDMCWHQASEIKLPAIVAARAIEVMFRSIAL